jgi:sterol desaturase/sphingolipid hydroxylase (fatty acid hydroxylase superfamily)
MSGSAEYHNFHHSHNIGNYSSFFSVWDTVFGTNKHYFEYKNRKERELYLNELRKDF